MAQATFRSFVGLAKDTTNANLQIAHAGGATTLTMANIVQAGTLLTASGATVTAFIVDGPLTESVACSGNATGTTDGSTIACAATANPHSANAYVYFQVTASKGPTAYLKVTKLDFMDDYAQLYDASYTGSNVKDVGAVQGKRSGKFTIDGNVFADSFGYVLGCLFGAYDYTATSGGNPTTYKFSSNNAGNGQGNKYLFYDYNPGASNFRVFAQTLCSDLTIKIDPGSLLNYSANFISFASGVVANPGTIPPTYSAFTAIPSRVSSVTIGGTATPKVVSAEYSYKREQAEAIETLNGIQDPLTTFAGALSLTVKSSIVVDDDVQLLNYINGSQPAWVTTCTQGSTTATNGIAITTTKSNYEQVKVVQSGGKGYVTLEVPFTAVANSTDTTTAGGGISPGTLTLSTGTTTGATIY